MLLVEGQDYYTRVIPFPNNSASGLTVLNADGTYSVYINGNLSLSAQRKAYRHEMDHIERDDFYSVADITEIEDYL